MLPQLPRVVTSTMTRANTAYGHCCLPDTVQNAKSIALFCLHTLLWDTCFSYVTHSNQNPFQNGKPEGTGQLPMASMWKQSHRGQDPGFLDSSMCVFKYHIAGLHLQFVMQRHYNNSVQCCTNLLNDRKFCGSKHTRLVYSICNWNSTINLIP